MKSIASLPITERPRERLIAHGAQSLRDEELLSIILGSGSSRAPLHEIAKRACAVIDGANGSLSPKSFEDVRGIGPSKATQICAAIEFARRRIKPAGVRVSCAGDVYPLLRHYGDRKQEHFIVIALNGAHEVLSVRVATVGLLNSAQVHPREVFAEAITERAAAIIVAHNHPSGALTPSAEDREVTARLKKSGAVLGIPVLDHLIFSRDGFMSFADQGLLGS